jgi:hypothetical protein
MAARLFFGFLPNLSWDLQAMDFLYQRMEPETAFSNIWRFNP